MTDQETIARLERAIDRMTDLGVYPASIEKNGVVTHRTEWQEGWNAALTEVHDVYLQALKETK